MRCVDIIEKKKRGEELSRDEIAYFVDSANSREDQF